MTELLSLKTTVKCCARCQGDHPDLEFKVIDNYEYATHYAICPNTGQPIMLKTSKTKAPKRKSRFSMEPSLLFERFWSYYPNKKKKGDAIKAWDQVKAANYFEAIMKALEWQRKTEKWRKDNGDWIPYPATWLRSLSWEDQPVSAPVSAPRGIQPPEVKR